MLGDRVVVWVQAYDIHSCQLARASNLTADKGTSSAAAAAVRDDDDNDVITE